MGKADQNKQYDKIRKRTFEIIQIGNRSDMPSLFCDFFIILVILINIAVTFWLTFDAAKMLYGALRTVELITILLFTVEYILRIWTADFLYPDISRVRAVWRFMTSFFGLIDLLTILPYFLPMLFPSGAVAFRMLRVVRMLHLFRINANYDAFNVITDVLKDKRDQILSSVFLIMVMVMASSLLMYGLEHEVQPENFSNAFSGIWWAVSTLLTVGYGDIYPITVGGRIMAIVIAFLGVGMVAIPTGIISAGFVEYYTKLKLVWNTKLVADFMTLTIREGHPFIGMKFQDVKITEGIDVAALLRGGRLVADPEETVIEKNDHILLVSDTRMHMDAHLDKVELSTGHMWIGKRIEELDISRQQDVLFVQRGARRIKPKEDCRLKEGDSLLILDRRGLS